MVFTHLAAEHREFQHSSIKAASLGLQSREGQTEEQIPKRKLAVFPEEGRGAGRKDIKCPQRLRITLSVRLENQPKEKAWRAARAGPGVHVTLPAAL